MFGLNGGRSGNETILIDGAPSQAVDWGGLMVSPINDSVQEQQIVQNEYDAQYERAGRRRHADHEERNEFVSW